LFVILCMESLVNGQPYREVNAIHVMAVTTNIRGRIRTAGIEAVIVGDPDEIGVADGTG